MSAIISFTVQDKLRPLASTSFWMAVSGVPVSLVLGIGLLAEMLYRMRHHRRLLLAMDGPDSSEDGSVLNLDTLSLASTTTARSGKRYTSLHVVGSYPDFQGADPVNV